MISIEQLSAILDISVKRIEPFYKWLDLYMNRYQINTPRRQAAFLAQIAHESGRFYYTEEIASGAKYDTGQLAIRLGNTPQADGDGQRYKGRGLIQLTGRSNYEQISKATGIDFVSSPELLKEPQYAVLSACWFWDSRRLNTLADVNDFAGITKKINGGYNGLADRQSYYDKFCKAFKI